MKLNLFNVIILISIEILNSSDTVDNRYKYENIDAFHGIQQYVPPISGIPIRLIVIPTEKIVPYRVDKTVPVRIEKPVPITVIKHVVVPVYKPYAVKIPVFKNIFHHSKKRFFYKNHH